MATNVISYARLPTLFALGMLASTLAGGCCCTSDRAIVRSPEVDVRVIDQQSGERVEGASIELCRVRIGPPPDAVVDRWEQTTDADGRVSFDFVGGSETTMPLMMHGVAQRAWEVCVRDDSQVRATRRLMVEKMPGEDEETPAKLSEQVIELPPPADEAPTCVCETLRDETGVSGQPE